MNEHDKKELKVLKQMKEELEDVRELVRLRFIFKDEMQDRDWETT